MCRLQARHTVTCPSCGRVYDDYYRPSVNFSLGESWTDDELKAATTATCPECGTTVELDALIVEEDER